MTGTNTSTGGGVDLVRLDTQGGIQGSRVLAGEAHPPYSVRLTAGPSGGALVTWVEGYAANGSLLDNLGTLYAELLAPDGSSAWSAVSVGTDVEEWSAVSTGDGFVLAVEWDPGATQVPLTADRSIQLFRLGLDGSLSMGGKHSRTGPGPGRPGVERVGGPPLVSGKRGRP